MIYSTSVRGILNSPFHHARHFVAHLPPIAAKEAKTWIADTAASRANRTTTTDKNRDNTAVLRANDFKARYDSLGS